MIQETEMLCHSLSDDHESYCLDTDDNLSQNTVDSAPENLERFQWDQAWPMMCSESTPFRLSSNW
jgi:hypothetical protein